MAVTIEVPVSVIVCTHNRAHYLPTCLQSLAQQNCDVSFEVLVVDNASTDDTPQITREWCLKDSRFRTAREDRLGLSTAKNTGVRLARGRLLLFTDDDVILDRNWVRSYLDFFRRRPNDLAIAGGPIIPIPNDLGSWPSWFDSCALPDLGLLDYRDERPLGPHEYVWGANMAIPASHFDRFGPWDENLGCCGEKRGTFEDTEYQDRVRSMGGTTWFCPSAKLQHRFPSRNIAPSRILGNANGRGRNQFWVEVLFRKERGTFSPRNDYFRCLGLLVRNLGAFAFWSLVFRFRGKQDIFVRAHAAAWSSGWSMDLLRAGRESSRLSLALGHTSLFIVRLTLRVLRRRKDRRG